MRYNAFFVSYHSIMHCKSWNRLSRRDGKFSRANSVKVNLCIKSVVNLNQQVKRLIWLLLNVHVYRNQGIHCWFDNQDFVRSGNDGGRGQ